MLSNERKWDEYPFTGSGNPVIAREKAFSIIIETVRALLTIIATSCATYKLSFYFYIN